MDIRKFVNRSTLTRARLLMYVFAIAAVSCPNQIPCSCATAALVRLRPLHRARALAARARRTRVLGRLGL